MGKKNPFFNRNHTRETKQKQSIAHLGICAGSEHWNWQNGITPLQKKIRACLKYRQWHDDIYTRDNFTCQDCGDNRGGNLNAHHIEWLSWIIKEYNITTLGQAENCEDRSVSPIAKN